jgi:hypothetical protein
MPYTEANVCRYSIKKINTYDHGNACIDVNNGVFCGSFPLKYLNSMNYF